MVFDPWFLTDGAVAIVLSAMLCWGLVVLARRWHRLTRSGDLGAVQASHIAPAPRLGGAAVALSLIVTILVTKTGGSTLWLWLWLALSALPLFLSGFAEDLGLAVSPRARLATAIVSAALLVVTTGAWVDASGLDPLDTLLRWPAVAIPLTVFACAGVAHAFNLIDGLNGLAGFTALVGAGGIAMTAHSVGDLDVLNLSVLLGASVLGFLLSNFPGGKIFLGDSGAYTIGFMLAAMAILLSSRHDDVAPMAMLLVLFWPLADTMLALWRRQRRKVPLVHPDRLHFHQLVMRALEIEVFGRRRRRVTNPLATVILLPAIALPAALGVTLHDRPAAATAAFGLCLGLFFATYAVGMHLATRRTRTTPRLSPTASPAAAPQSTTP